MSWIITALPLFSTVIIDYVLQPKYARAKRGAQPIEKLTKSVFSFTWENEIILVHLTSRDEAVLWFFFDLLRLPPVLALVSAPASTWRRALRCEGSVDPVCRRVTLLQQQVHRLRVEKISGCFSGRQAASEKLVIERYFYVICHASPAQCLSAPLLPADEWLPPDFCHWRPPHGHLSAGQRQNIEDTKIKISLKAIIWVSRQLPFCILPSSSAAPFGMMALT